MATLQGCETIYLRCAIHYHNVQSITTMFYIVPFHLLYRHNIQNVCVLIFEFLIYSNFVLLTFHFLIMYMFVRKFLLKWCGVVTQRGHETASYGFCVCFFWVARDSLLKTYFESLIHTWSGVLFPANYHNGFSQEILLY